ncbi:MAG: HAD family hydrolase [Myxococcales bacterium]|jgi:beta-phosphoglucomutase
MKTRRAAIFDLDGTLVDNMRFHAIAWVELSRGLGLDVPREFFERETAGKKNVEILALLLKREIDAEELAQLSERKESLYRELYRPHLAPVAGLHAFLDRLEAAGAALAVATLAPEANRAMVLQGLGLESRFSLVLGAEQARRGKPAPDIYLAAASALGLEPSACVAFEDAVNGVLSARDAGMAVVGLTTSTSAEALVAAGASWIAPDFASLPAEAEEALGTKAAA